MSHWTKGGTGITNFSPDLEEVYRKAIEENQESGLWIERFPMEKTAGQLL